MIISGIALDFLNISWFVKLAQGMKPKPEQTGSESDQTGSESEPEMNEFGQVKSEDPTEGSIFGRVNVQTRILIDQMRKKSLEQINFVSFFII